VAPLLRAGPLAAVILAALALNAGCSTVPPRSPQQLRADEATTDRITLALDEEPVYFFRHVDVDVQNGVATLSGYVWTTDALYVAQQITRRVPGVTRVVNRMELEREAERGGGDSSGAQ
jgi:osmotically-inducible protein OsmY